MILSFLPSVNGTIYMGSSKSLLVEFKSNMMKRLESDLCIFHYFLG